MFSIIHRIQPFTNTQKNDENSKRANQRNNKNRAKITQADKLKTDKSKTTKDHKRPTAPFRFFITNTKKKT